MIDIYLIDESYIVVTLIIIFDIWLGLWVYFANRKSKVNQQFFLLTFFLLLWAVLCYIKSTLSQDISLILVRMAYGVVAIFFTLFYFFLNNFPKKEEKKPILDKIILGVGLFLFLFSFGDSMVESIGLTNEKNIPILGVGRFIYLGLTSVLILFITARFFKKYLGFSKKEKLRAQYFLIGFTIFILVNLIFNIIIPLLEGNAQYSCIGNHSAIFFLILTAYAITKHNLMGIKTLLTQILIIVIAIIFLLDIVTLSDNLTMQILKIGILITFLYFSRGMIESVKKEKQAKEELQKIYWKVNHYAKKLEKVNQDLKELLEAKDDFLHITSHQLRTPLTVIRGMLAMWRAGDFDGLSKEEREKMKEKIYLSAERLNNITNDILDAMEVEGKFLKFNLEFASLEDVIREAMKELKMNYDKKGLYLKLNVEGKLPKIKLELKYFKQALMNLLDNAEKYTSRGGVEIIVCSKVSKDDKKNKFVLIEIKDTGIGINKRDQKELFQKFSRTGSGVKQNTTGSGLGLFIAKQIIEEHQGKIEISSEGAGKGTTVKVWLLRN